MLAVWIVVLYFPEEDDYDCAACYEYEDAVKINKKEFGNKGVIKKRTMQ